MKALDQRFYLRDEANPYFTFIYGTMETATGVLRLVRAGHPYPILHTALGEQRALRPDGYAIGLFPQPTGRVRSSATGERLTRGTQSNLRRRRSLAPTAVPRGAPRLFNEFRARDTRRESHSNRWVDGGSMSQANRSKAKIPSVRGGTRTRDLRRDRPDRPEGTASVSR